MKATETYTVTVHRLLNQGADLELAGRYVGTRHEALGKLTAAHPELDMTVGDMLREVKDRDGYMKTDQVDIVNEDGTTTPAKVEVEAA